MSESRTGRKGGLSPSQRRVAVYLLIAALGAYIAPVVAGAVVAPFGGLNGESGPGLLLLLVMTTGGPLAQASVVLTPLIAGLTVATMWTKSYRRWAYVIIGLSAAGIFACVVLWYYMSGPSAEPMSYYATTNGYDDPVRFADLKERFLTGVMSALTTMIAVVLGLRAATGADSDA